MKTRLLPLFAVVSIGQGGAAAEQVAITEPKWLTDANGCKFLSPLPRMPDTVEWDGKCVDGFVSGPGELRVAKILYRGDFSQGRLVKGSVERSNGEIAEGEFLDNLLHGEGIVRSREGIAIKARFEKGEMQGDHAEITWPSGASYRGQVDPRTQSLHGKGVMKYASGSVYEGEFHQNVLAGAGVMTTPDGEVRRGTYVGGELSGKGSILYADKALYEGELLAGNPHGTGRMKLADGAVYEGSFVAGKLHGKGEMTYADGGFYRGDVVAGEAHGSGAIRYRNGNRYVGQFIAGSRHGKGTFTQASGETFEGDWKANELTGKCRIVAQESVYEGECIEAKAHGTGRLEDKTRKLLYEGAFINDRFDGKGTLHIDGLTMRGDFRAGILARGTITGDDARTFEVDLEKGEILEVMKDGSKRPLDQLPEDLTI